MSSKEAPSWSPTIEALKQIYTPDGAEGDSNDISSDTNPDTANESQPVVATEQEELNSETADTAEPTSPEANSDAYTNTADAFERVAQWLRDRSETKDDRQTTRAEQLAQAKETVVQIGDKALSAAQTIDLVTVGLTILAVEAGVNKIKETREKISTAAREANERRAQRRTKKSKLRAWDQAIDMNDTFDDNKRLKAEAEARRQVEEAEAQAEELAILEEAHQDNTDFDENRRLKEEENARLEAEAEQAELKHQAELEARRKAALARKADRRARREEFVGNARDKGSEVYTTAKGYTKRFGRAAIRAFRRGHAAARGAVSGAAEAWNQAGA